MSLISTGSISLDSTFKASPIPDNFDAVQEFKASPIPGYNDAGDEVWYGGAGSQEGQTHHLHTFVIFLSALTSPIINFPKNC